MANEVVTFRQGQFVDPNMDSNKVTANNDSGVGTQNAINGIVVRQLVNQAKGTTLKLISRGTKRSGSISKGDNINKTVGLVGDATMLLGAWAFGPVSGGITTLGLGIEKALEADDISYQLKVDDLTAREDARQYGMSVNDRGDFR